MNFIDEQLRQLRTDITPTSVVHTFDQATFYEGIHKVRNEMPLVLGKGWNAKGYTREELRKLSEDTRFSPEARAALRYLASPDSDALWAQWQDKGDAAGVPRMDIDELEKRINDLAGDRADAVAGATTAADKAFVAKSAQLIDSYKSTIQSIGNLILGSGQR